MNSAPVSTPTARPPVPKRRRWLRGILAGVVLLTVTPLALVTYSNITSTGAWTAAEEEASRDDPRWRLLEMEADRIKLADADNSALHIMATLRKGGRVSIGAVPNYDAIFDKLPPNAQLNGQQVQLIRTEFAKLGGALEDARKLKDMPEGRFPITYNDDFISTLIPDHQNARQIAEWLQHDAWLLAQEGDCDGAIESCQAIINGGRSMKDDPMLITCLIRLALQRIALESLERALAQGEAKEEHLRAMQTMLEQELQQDSFIQGVRGERAGIHHLFENLRAGKVKPDFMRMVGGPGLNPASEWLSFNFPSTMLRHYPEHLQQMNRTLAAAKLPLHERGAKMEELRTEIRRSRNPVTRILAPATEKVEKADRRSQINLRCMVVALACERYRLKHDEKRWPATLDDLVKAKLAGAIPTDPIDNQPLRYRRTKEGIVVYSIGFDEKDDQGNIDREQWNTVGVDLGFRLWDLHLRRAAPLPPVGLPVGPQRPGE